jgi:hypothetical protein
MVQAGGKPSNFVLVKVVAFQKGKALCKARFERNWHKIVMIQGSIKRTNLRESDAFEWIPNDDGIVAGRDNRGHPRRADAGESERAATTVKTTGYHRVTGPLRNQVIRLLLCLGWAKEYHDRAYGGHGDIWEEWGVEFRERKIKEGGYIPLA